MLKVFQAEIISSISEMLIRRKFLERLVSKLITETYKHATKFSPYLEPFCFGHGIVSFFHYIFWIPSIWYHLLNAYNKSTILEFISLEYKITKTGNRNPNPTFSIPWMLSRKTQFHTEKLRLYNSTDMVSPP